MEHGPRISCQVMKSREKIISHQSLAYESKFPLVHNCAALGRKGAGKGSLVDVPVVTLLVLNSCSCLNGLVSCFIQLLVTWKVLILRTVLKEKRETT